MVIYPVTYVCAFFRIARVLTSDSLDQEIPFLICRLYIQPDSTKNRQFSVSRKVLSMLRTSRLAENWRFFVELSFLSDHREPRVMLIGHSTESTDQLS